MPSLLNFLPNAVGQGQAQLIYAEVTTPVPTAFTDPLFVVLPEWSLDFPVEITNWEVAHGLTLPSLGSAVLLVVDSRKNVRAVWWDGSSRVTSARVSASQMGMYGNSQFTMGGTNTILQSSIRQHTPTAGGNVCIMYQSVMSTGEQNLGGDGSNMTVRCAVEYPQSTFYPAYTQDGNRDATLTPNGGICRLWVPGFEVPANQDWFVRTRAIMGANGAFAFVNFTDGVTEGFYGPTTGTADFTTSGTFNSAPTSSSAIAPNLITYEPFLPLPCVAILGDSIAAGKFDPDTLSGKTSNAGGWAVRALSSDGVTGRSSPMIPNVNMASESETAANVATAVKRRTRIQFFDEANCTSAFVALGINDLGDSVATIQSNLQTIWQALADRNIRVFAFTLTPHSTSTDNWATVVNQTPASDNTKRSALNAWLRTGASFQGLSAGQVGHPVFMVIDVCSSVETSQDSGLWLATGTAFGYTADGLHPNPLGYVLMARLVSTTAVPHIV